MLLLVWIDDLRLGEYGLSQNLDAVRAPRELVRYTFKFDLNFFFAVCLVFRLDDRMATFWSIWWQSRWLKHRVRVDQSMWVQVDHHGQC
jgi:hypothetical protein